MKRECGNEEEGEVAIERRVHDTWHNGRFMCVVRINFLLLFSETWMREKKGGGVGVTGSWNEWCHGELGRSKRTHGVSEVNGDGGMGIATREGTEERGCQRGEKE